MTATSVNFKVTNGYSYVLFCFHLHFRLKYFNVHPDTGVVYVANSRLIDREVTTLYSAILQARDTDNKTGFTALEITLTDINDNRPEFNRDPYLEFVKEGEQVDLKLEVSVI